MLVEEYVFINGILSVSVWDNVHFKVDLTVIEPN